MFQKMICSLRGHHRDSERMRKDRHGAIVAPCVRCGVRLRRDGPGEWVSA